MDAETINLVADEFGFKTEYVSAEVQEAVSEEEDDENDLIHSLALPFFGIGMKPDLFQSCGHY